jgi:hypothetical protein
VKRRRPVHMLALVLGVIAAVPSIAAADTSFPAAAGHMTAGGDLLVWTPWTGPGRLMSGFGAAASPLPIPRARFASVDLGTDARGRAVLLYSACQIRRPRHCDLGLYDFATRRHRRLSGLSLPGCSERGARVSHGAIVFARDCSGSAGSHLDGVHLKRPGRSVRRVRGLPRAPESFDLAGDTLAFVERRVSDGPEESTFRVTTEVRVLELGRRRSRLLAREQKIEAPAPSGTYVQDVRLDSGYAYWERQVFSTGNPPVDVFRQQIVRRPIDASAPEAQLERAGRLYVESTGSDRLGSYAVSGDRLYYSRPAYVTGSEAFIAQVAGTPVFR